MLTSPGEEERRHKRDIGHLEETDSTRKLWNLTKVFGVAQSAALQISAISTVGQRIRGGDTPCRVSSHPQGAQLALGLVCQGEGIHYPVGQPLLGDSLPFLLTSIIEKELLGQCLLVYHLITKMRRGNLVHVSRLGSQDNVRHSNAKAGSASFEGSACRFTT